jgi:hypothetical protein
MSLSLAKIKCVFKMMFPDGGNIWEEKNNGGDLEKKIDGFSGQFKRDADQITNFYNMMDPSKTVFLDEWDQEFDNAIGALTDPERRGRFDARMRMLFFTKSRLADMEETLRLSGFDDVSIRTLGWFGLNESPYDFYPDSGFAFWGADEAIYGADDFIYNNSEVTGNAFLITNGGSTEYVAGGPDAIIQLEQNPDYWGAYFVIEEDGQGVLSIPERLRETFFDLLYLLKPAQMHGILRAEFTV